jgi:outer membrane receptor protein involved in Fe transport
MKRIVLFIISLLIITSLRGQDTEGGKVYGKVRMAASGEPFANVSVALYSLPDSAVTLGTATDDNGDFEIKRLPDNDYILVPSFVGYGSKIIRFSITPESRELNAEDIILAEKTEDLGDVSVTAAKPQIIYRDNKKILTVKEFTDAGATTLAEVLENAPSITLDSEGNVILRGSSNYTLLIDGKPVPGVGVNMLRQIPPEMVDNIEIMTNPSAKYDPDGVAGIINLVLKKQSESGFNGQITTMAGLGHKYNGDIQINYRGSKYNLYAGISGTSYNTFIDGDILRRTEDISGESEISNYMNQKTEVKTVVANLGIDIIPDDKNTISISGRFGPQKVGATLDNQVEREVNDPGLTWS